MTVSSTTTRNSYSGDGSTTAFSYTFKIFDEDDIAVILRDDTTAVETTQTITTNYTVSGVGNAGGGTITFVTAPPSGKTVVLLRATPLSQLTDYTPNDPFPAESHEDALDKLTFITQELSEEIGRAIKLSKTNEIATAEFTVGATARANKVLGFDGNGDLAVLQEIGIYKGTDTTTTTADYDARDIVKSTTAAQLNNVYIALQDSPTGTLLTNTTYWELLVDAVSAATSATNAANSASAASTSASNAATSETNAATSETNAATSETNAATSETNAATSATNASNAQTAAETALDTFDDTYLGAKATNPTVDNDGDPLAAGMLYTNTTDGNLYWYDGSGWNDVTAGAGGLNDVVDDTSPQLGGTLDVNNQLVQFADSTGATDNRLQLGTGQDMQLYHDGTTNKIDTSATQELHVNSDDVLFYDNSGTTRTVIVSPGSTMNFQLYDSTGTVRVFAVNGSGNEFHRSVYIQDQRSLGFKEDTSNGSNYVAFQAPAAIAANVTWTLPDADGTSGQSIVTDGAGVLSWGSGGGGSFLGDSGGGLADIIRVHEEQLDTDVTVAANTNGLCAGPLTVATGVTVTVNGNLVIA